MEELFKPIPDYAKRDGVIWMEHYSPSAIEKPLANWVFDYVYLGGRRRDIRVGAPAPAGGAAHDAIQAVVCDDVEIGEVKFINGMLTINLQKIIPEHQQLKVYDID